MEIIMSKVEAQNKTNNDLNNVKSLNEIEATSETLYLDKCNSSPPSAARNQSKSAKKVNASMPKKSKHGDDGPSLKDKKSIWNWKPLKALSHVRNRRFNCGVTLEVHTIEGLPSEFNGLSLTVHWKRRDGELVTRPIKVVECVAQFEEKLIQKCSVYGSRNGPHHSAKYEAKHFLFYAAVNENPKLDLGKHRIDLTRILPLTLEELEGEKSSGTWTTDFKLLGNANGAVMNVSFGYVVLGDYVSPNNKNALKLLELKPAVKSSIKSDPSDEMVSIRRTGTFPLDQKSSMTSRSVDVAKVLHEVTPMRTSEFSSSLNILYQKFDDEDSTSVMDDKLEIEASAGDVEAVKSASCSPSYLSTGISADENENEHAEFSISNKGIEPEKKLEFDQNSTKFDDQPVPGTPDLPVTCNDNQGNLLEEPDVIRNEDVISYLNCEQRDLLTKESLLEDLESVLSHVAILEKEALDTSEDESVLSDQEYEVDKKTNGVTQSNLEAVAESATNLEKETLDRPEGEIEPSEREGKVEHKSNRMTQSNLDQLVDSVADEFLSMLGIGDSPFSFNSDEEFESPRERLLRQYEEAEASGCSLFDFDIDEEVETNYEEENVVYCNYHAPTISLWEEEELSDCSDLFPVAEPESPELRARVMSEYPKIRAKVVEDFDTEALIQEWSWDEKAFESSPSNSDGNCRIPINLSSIEPPPLPSLGEGLGSSIQTKTGGFLRSMNPLLFRNAKGGGNLIVQVSSPVVVPAESGSGVMEVLQNLASVGLEQLSMQAKKLMPLEEISGKTMQQIAWEAAHLEASERKNLLWDVQEGRHATSLEKKRDKRDSSGRKTKQANPSSVAYEVDEYVFLEDLAPLAIDKIEALTLEGLGIQCGMAEEEAPSSIKTQSFGKFSALEGKRAASTGPMGLEGAVGLQLLNLKDDEADDIDGLMGLSLTLEEWMKLDCGEFDEDEQMGERTSKLLAAHHASCTDLNSLGKGKTSGRRCGLLGNSFIVALMVQLHDSLRNFEPVGTPMLALIQVERVFLPPKPKIYDMVVETRTCDEEDDQLEITQDQELISYYKINEVHVAGLETEPCKKKLWGSAAQQQAGSRWLLANGIGKDNKNPFMKSKHDTLWSISSQFLGNGAKWEELTTLNPHIRNPNIILPNETIKLW